MNEWMNELYFWYCFLRPCQRILCTFNDMHLDLRYNSYFRLISVETSFFTFITLLWFFLGRQDLKGRIVITLCWIQLIGFSIIRLFSREGVIFKIYIYEFIWKSHSPFQISLYLAPATLAAWMTDKPSAPRPNTATEAPGWT